MQTAQYDSTPIVAFNHDDPDGVALGPYTAPDPRPAEEWDYYTPDQWNELWRCAPEPLELEYRDGMEVLV